jgi:hypothetical protein
LMLTSPAVSSLCHEDGTAHTPLGGH